jgi:hypothetical protein
MIDQQPVKPRREISLSWLVLAILFVLYQTGKVDLSFSATNASWEELEYEPGPPPEKPKALPEISIQDFIIEKGRGYDLREEVKRKLKKELDRLEHSEQYVLLTTQAGWYECPTCLKQYRKEKIYLQKGQILKYGVSTRKDKRYDSSYYRRKQCRYKAEFKGNYYECLVEEKKKIYYYLIHPENLARDKPLISTPWNLTSN